MDPTTGHGLCKSGRLCLRRECKRGGGQRERFCLIEAESGREWQRRDRERVVESGERCIDHVEKGGAEGTGVKETRGNQR